MDISLFHLSQDVWNKVLDHAENSVVFIDSKAGECLHWSVGVEKLLLGGALGIKEFSAYKYFQDGAVENAQKAVFISVSSYSAIQVDLCDILSQSSFLTAIVIMIPLHDPSSVIPSLRNDILQWMSIGNGTSKGISVEIFCFPFFAPITETVIMFPSFRDLFPPLDLNKVKSFGSKPDSLSMKDQASAEQLAVHLDSLLSQIGAADVIFSVGVLSNAVATALEALPSANHRRKVAQNRMSVVIVDRTLDLCAPASVDSKCFLDKMLCALPHLPNHSNDIAVNMSQIAQVTVDSIQDEALFPGCLAHQENVCRNATEWLISKKDRDILLNLHQILKSKLSSNSNFATRVKPEALEKDVRQFRGNIEKIQQNSGILQIALAVVQTLTGEHTEDVEVILSAERVLRQNVASFTETNELAGLLPQLTKLMTERHIRNLTLDAILRLVVLLYSLIGTDMTFPLREEVQLQAAISTALYEDQEYPGLVHDILLPLDSTKDKVDSVAAHIFSVLKALSHARRDLTKYRSLLRGKNQSMPSEYAPVLQQIMKDILDPSKPLIPDLSCRSTGLRDLLKSGFSILLNKQQASAVQHPSDQPNLLVLVLGGITGGEINSIQEAWMSSSLGKAGGSLLVASTRLLSPNDTLQAILKSNPQP